MLIPFQRLRSKASLADGVTFQVEWSDSLEVGSWSSFGVSETLDPENPGNAEIENVIATLSASTLGKRFVRLRITSPGLAPEIPA